MQKLITVHLDSHLFQLDEPAYCALRAYLEHAEAQLGANPDKTEIVRDLEQSIAEKVAKMLAPTKMIVSAADVSEVLREIGPVDAGVPGGNPAAAPGIPRSASEPRRLYKIRDGAIISGLANGIAAYFTIDPTLVRIAFVLAALVEITVFDRPSAAVIGLYLILMVLVPYPAAASREAATPGIFGPLVDKMRFRLRHNAN